MTDAVIVSTARTGLGKSWKGAFNMTYGATLGAHAVQHAVARAGIDPAEVEDVIMGSTFGEGTTGGNIARAIALRAGLPVTTAGLSINRFCSSGLQSIALAAQRVMTEGARSCVAGGLESISCVQNETNTHMLFDPWLTRAQADALLVDAADRRDRGQALPHPQAGAGRVRRAQPAARRGRPGGRQVQGRNRADDAPSWVWPTRRPARILTPRGHDRPRRGHPRRTPRWRRWRKIRPALPGGVITAGNASQFSDGSSACVVMDAQARRAARPAAARDLPRLRRRRLRTGRDGHRAGLRRAAAAQALRL